MGEFVLFEIYNNNKVKLVKYLVEICINAGCKSDYTPYIINLLDDFIGNHCGPFEGVFLNAWKYIVKLTLAAFWILDKYIEDDHFFLTDVLELTSKDITNVDILKCESEIIEKCSNIGLYIESRNFN